MRSKTRIVQTSLRRSPRKLPASASRALPVLLTQDDESPGKSEDPQKTVRDTYSDTDSAGNGDNGGIGVNLVGKEGNLSPQVGDNCGDSMDLDSLGLGICIRCNVSDALVLVCGEVGCLIAVHERCMGCRPSFDESGKLRCPVCEQKRATVQVEEARRKVMEAKRALSSFLEGGAVVGSKEDSGVRDNVCCDDGGRFGGMGGDRRKGMGNAQSSCDQEKTVVQTNNCVANGGANVGSSSEGAKVGINLAKGSVPDTRGLETVEEGGKEDLEPVDEDIAEDREVSKGLDSNEGADKRVSEKDEGMEEAHPESSDEYDVSETKNQNEGEDKGVPEKNESIEEGGEELQPEASEELGSAKDISETESLAERPKRFKRRAGKTSNATTSHRGSPQVKAAFSRRKAIAKKNASTFHKKGTTPNKSKQSANSFTMDTFPQEKRKRLHWTSEEEETLRQGVLEFTQATNKNISWKSILEFGHQVFHTTRTPRDLRDKWRTMMAKDGVRRR